MNIIGEVLRRVHIDAPDGRLLHAYEVTEDEQERLGKFLRMRIGVHQRLTSTAQGFVLWAAERIRTRYRGGHLTWEFVFEGLGTPNPDYPFISWLAEQGFAAWKRPLRRGSSGDREFLYSLLAEGGLPDAALAEAGRYRQVLLGLVAEIEDEGTLAHAMAETAAKRRLADLPQVLRSDEQARLMADLALALRDLRSQLPADQPVESTERWLDVHRPDWRSLLPIRMSPQALEALIRPVLTAVRRQRGGMPVQRELRLGDKGDWVGVARILDDAVIAADLLPEAAGQRLRLLATTGAAFLAQPQESPSSGWRLSRVAGSSFLALAPDEAVVLSAYADGRAIGEVVLDAGFPAPIEASSLWRSEVAGAASADVLVPLSGRGRTRAAQAWLLLPPGVCPKADDGLTVGAPAPAPGGQLWPVSGQGRLCAGSQAWTIATSAESDESQPHLLATGRLLPGFIGSGGAPVFLGEPTIFGAEGNAPMRRLGTCLTRRPTRRTLGAQVAAWEEDGAVLARIRLIVLPSTLKLDLNEIAAGRLRLVGANLRAGWHAALCVGDNEASAIVKADGEVRLELVAKGAPGLVQLRLSDPADGLALELATVWPARQALLITPDGYRLEHNRELSLGRLAGWRGILPGGGGAVVLRGSDGHRKRIGFAASGEARLAGFAPLIGQALALAGADGRVNLRLAAYGGETPRLEIGRYDWASEEAGPFRHLPGGRTRLSAVYLDDPQRTAEIEADGRIDLTGWLGEEKGVWFVQGRSDSGGVMRPLAWSAWPMVKSTREERLQRYAAAWMELLERPADRGWDRAWTLITAVRCGGDAGALDQVQALARTPAAAVALLLSVPRTDRAAALALESEAPIWWPLVTCVDWAKGFGVAIARIHSRLTEQGMPDIGSTLAAVMARIAGEVVGLRPELAAHLGQALAAAGMAPVAMNAQGHGLPLASAKPASHLAAVAQEAARRFDRVPDGAAGLRAEALEPPKAANAVNAALLHAPLVVAEAAAGLRARNLESDDMLRLIALRAADPVYFESALPAALTLGMSITNSRREAPQ
jgi:hypothetical protein